MRASVVPDLIDAFVRNATEALAEVDLGGGEYATVYDGIGNSDDPGAYLMVGVDDEDPGNSAGAASSDQTWAHANGRARDEEGDVSCVAFAWNGGGDDAQRVCRDQAYAIADVLAEQCRAQDLSAGVDGVWSLSFTDTRLQQDVTEAGNVLAFLLFRIHFKARI